MMLVVPVIKIKNVLQEMHNGSAGAHFGINKTLSNVRERFYWVRCRDHVETCAAVKERRTRGRGPMQQYNVGSPFKRIAVDIAVGIST